MRQFTIKKPSFHTSANLNEKNSVKLTPGCADMRKTSTVILLILILFASGCSSVLVYTGSLKDRENVRLIDPENGPISVEEIAISDTETDYQANYSGFSIELDQPCRVKYYRTFGFIGYQNIWVTGQLPNGNRYPVLIDSGFHSYLETNDIVILENDLAIYPLEMQNSSKGTFDGVCHLPEFHIGEMKLINPPCEYSTLHWERRLLGLPLRKEKNFFLGLKLLGIFQYVLLDGVEKEVEFSLNNPFEPDKPEEWTTYDFVIKEDEYGTERMMIDIPIAGNSMPLFFDTGSGAGLLLSAERWEAISDKVIVKKFKNSKKNNSWIGWFKCRKAIVSKLDILGRTIKNAEVLILPENSPLKVKGLLGMEYFQDTVMVLDFERKLLWIKAAP